MLLKLIQRTNPDNEIPVNLFLPNGTIPREIRVSVGDPEILCASTPEIIGCGDYTRGRTIMGISYQAINGPQFAIQLIDNSIGMFPLSWFGQIKPACPECHSPNGTVAQATGVSCVNNSCSWTGEKDRLVVSCAFKEEDGTGDVEVQDFLRFLSNQEQVWDLTPSETKARCSWNLPE